MIVSYSLVTSMVDAVCRKNYPLNDRPWHDPSPDIAVMVMGVVTSWHGDTPTMPAQIMPTIMRPGR
jgi:hypothetical protein